MDQCLFCSIANGKIPAKKVFEDEKVAAVLDINPGAPGHILVIPKQHVEILLQMDDDLSAHIGMVSKQLSHALLQALKCEGTSIFVANGPVAGQRAPHGMVHVIPRSKGDEIALDLPIIRLDETALNETYIKLSQIVAKALGKEPMKAQIAEVKKKEPKKSEEAAPKKDNSSKEIKELKKAEGGEKKDEKKSSSNLDDIADFLVGGKK